MAKEVSGLIKLQIRGGAANPAPPVGPALGAKGVNIMEFCKQFNARTQDKAGKVCPVLITVYSDKSFDFVIKTPPAANLILEAMKKQKGSAEPNRSKVGSITWDQVKAIAEIKEMGNIILFIDEIHTIVGAGAAEGAIDASNILKPSLARGEIQLIGATTIDEYRKHIEKDPALERRFQPVKVEEPFFNCVM